MYTLEKLKQKSLKELKDLGWQLNVLPSGDRRRRQSWIDALVPPPLLHLLEVSPSVEVEQVQEAIEPVAETSPAVSVEQAQEAIEVQAQEPPLESKFGRIVYQRPAQKSIAQAAETSPGVQVDRALEPIIETAKNSPGVDPGVVRAQEPISHEEARPQLYRTQSADVHNRRSHPAKSDRDSSGAKTEAPGSPEGDRVLAVAGNHQTGRGRVLPDQSIKLVNFTEADHPLTRGDDGRERLENEPRMSQSAIAQAAETSPGVEVDRAREPIMETVEASPGVDLVEDELPGCSNCFGDGYVEDEFGFVKFCQCKTEPRLSHQRTQRAIAQAAQKSPGVDCVYGQSETDLNPILTRIVFSDKFLACYSPPQSEIIHYKADTDGQLSLLDFETESSDEPPDPDDFESIDAFREA